MTKTITRKNGTFTKLNANTENTHGLLFKLDTNGTIQFYNMAKNGRMVWREMLVNNKMFINMTNEIIASN